MPGSPRDSFPDDAQTVAALRLIKVLQPAMQRHDRAEIVRLIPQLIELRPPMGEQWISLGQVAADNGEFALARAAAAIHLERTGGSPGAQFQYVRLLASMGAWEEVHAILRELPEDLPDRATYACQRGTAAMLLGLSEEARHYLGEAVALRPQWGAAWIWLGGLVNFAHEPELAERLIAGADAIAGLPAQERGNYLYALGKAHADRDERALAFAAYARGAGFIKQQLPYSREQDRRLARDSLDGYDAARIAAIAGTQTESTDRTIFVMGLPRSGTTLAEQILASHSAVSDGAEINRLPLLLREVGGLPYAALEAYVAEAGAPAAARLWRHWIDERFPAPGRVVDKTFTTTRLLGLAAALLPEAPLIWLTRDPFDCAWSCFRTPFKTGTPWSYDLEDLAFHFRLEDELRARWQAILGDRLLIVPYEALASEPEPSIRRILAHCGLDAEPQAFAPHENKRSVTTASTMQVRQPINRNAIGSVEPYRDFLEPFTRAYRD